MLNTPPTLFKTYKLNIWPEKCNFTELKEENYEIVPPKKPNLIILLGFADKCYPPIFFFL